MSGATLDPVTIIMPAFNEEDAVADEVRAVAGVMATTGRQFEVLVVDDGSADRTSERAREANARVLRHVENRGYGAALKTGIDAARHELIVIKDADGSYPAVAIPELLAALEHADMVVGARTGDEVRTPLVRRPAKWVLRKLAARVAGKKIPDLNSGLRVFRRSYVRQYFEILPDQFSFTTTITLSFIADGYRIAYHPINYLRRIGTSKIRPWHFMDFMMLVLRITMLFQPLRIFVPMSLLTGGLGVLKFGFDLVAVVPRNRAFEWSLLLQPVFSTSAVLLILVSVQLLAIGMLADGILRRLAQQRGPLLPSRAVLGAEASP